MSHGVLGFETRLMSLLATKDLKSAPGKIQIKGVVFPFKIDGLGVPCYGSVGTNLSSSHEDGSSSPGLAQWLRSLVAVAAVYIGSCSSESTPSLGISVCHRRGPKKEKKKLIDAR